MTDVRHSSATCEWYTPAAIVDIARGVMGTIELDPASCAEANATVKADRYFTKEQDGLSQPWASPAVYCNPPYGVIGGRSQAGMFLDRATAAVYTGEAQQVFMVLKAAFGYKWIRPLMLPAWSICLLHDKVQFSSPGQTRAACPHGSILCYNGTPEGRARFQAACAPLGRVVL